MNFAVIYSRVKQIIFGSSLREEPEQKENSQNNTVMSKEYVAARKVSAIVAMALAVVVSFAAINSYGDSKSEDFIVYDIEASVEKAFAELTEQNLVFEIEEEKAEIIKIYNSDFELVKSIMVTADEVIEDEAAKQLLNRAEYLSSYGSTSVYKIIE